MLLKRGSGSGERKSAVADPGGGGGGGGGGFPGGGRAPPPPPPTYFQTKLRPEEREKKFPSFSTRRKEHSNFLGPHFQQLHSQ